MSSQSTEHDSIKMVPHRGHMYKHDAGLEHRPKTSGNGYKKRFEKGSDHNPLECKFTTVSQYMQTIRIEKRKENSFGIQESY